MHLAAMPAKVSASTFIAVMSISWVQIEAFLKLLEATKGRDKVARLLQYGAKYLKWVAETQTPKNERQIVMWTELGGAMSSTRKALRLFKFLECVRSIQKKLAGKSLGELDIVTLLEIFVDASDTVFFLADNVELFGKLKWIKPTPEQSDQLNWIINGSWLFEILGNLAIQFIKYNRLAAQPDGKLVQLQRQQIVRNIVRNSFDVPLCFHFVNLTGKWPHCYFGLLGVGSSLISLYDMWPATPAPAAKA